MPSQDLLKNHPQIEGQIPQHMMEWKSDSKSSDSSTKAWFTCAEVTAFVCVCVCTYNTCVKDMTVQYSNSTVSTYSIVTVPLYSTLHT